MTEKPAWLASVGGIGICVLCGHAAPGDHLYMGGMVDGMPLCHQDDHSCYHRWTVYGERPAVPQTGAGE